MLLSGVVHKDIDLTEFIGNSLNRFLTKFFIADIAIDQQTFFSLLLNETLCFSGILRKNGTAGLKYSVNAAAIL